MTDDPNAVQDAVEQAAETSRKQFHGIWLQPFSPRREFCFQRLGGERIGSNNEAFFLIVYLCTLGDEIVEEKTFNVGGKPQTLQITGKDLMESARGVTGVSEFRERFYKWVKEHGISGNNPAGVECYDLGRSVWEETEVSRFRVKPSGEGLSPNA